MSVLQPFTLRLARAPRWQPLHWLGRAFLALTQLALLMGPLGSPVPAVQAVPTNQLRLRVVAARTEPRFNNGAGITAGTLITTYEFLINADNTGVATSRAAAPECDPAITPDLAGCDWPSIRAVPGSAPIVTQGDQTILNATTGFALPDGRYLISVMADGFKVGGAHFTIPYDDANGPIEVALQPNPLPLATLRIQVFEDSASPDGQMNAPVEQGLNGFEAHLSDVLGEVSTDWYGNPLCTEYERDNAGQVILDGDGNPTPIAGTGGKCLSGDTNHDGTVNAQDDPADQGMVTIPNLGSNRYAALVIPPDGTNWVQTTTLEGGHDWDTWLQEGATGYDTEFLFAAEPFPWTMFGFVRPRPIASNPSTRSITGRAVGVKAYIPPVGGQPGQGNNAGISGMRIDRPIDRPYIALSDLLNGDQMVFMGRGNADGTFTIPNVPPGEYSVTVWDGLQYYLLDFFQVTVGAADTVVNLGDVFLTGWFANISGYVFVDNGVAADGQAFAPAARANAVRDCRVPDDARTCEAGMPNQGLVVKSRSNNIVQHGGNSGVTDGNGFYEIPNVYPWTNYQILENYNDRFYTTGITYQADNQPAPTTVLGTGVDVNVMAIFGLSGTLDWGVLPYERGTNGGIVGTVSYDVTRNELNPRLAAAEDWQPGIPGLTMNLYAAVRQPNGTYTPGNLLNTTTTEAWTRPTNTAETPCTPRDVNSDSIDWLQRSVPFSTTLGAPCVEAPLMGIQFGPNFDGENWNASVDGNYGFGDGCFQANGQPGLASAEGQCSAGTLAALPPGDYLVEVVIPNDAFGRPIYRVTREEDINVFDGDAYLPLQPPPPCAGPLHTVDVAGVGPDGPDATVNPNFAAEGGSPYEGQATPLCNFKYIRLQDRRSIAPGFNLFTDVPLPGRFIGYMVDDLNLSTDPLSTLLGEKAGLANAPVGIYDFTDRLVTTIETDPNGIFEVLLPSTLQINCPTPSGVCPNMYRMVGNDPGQPGRLNPNHNPQYRTISANFEVWPGIYNPADLAPTQIAVSIQGPGAQFNAVAQCALDTATPKLFAVSRPFVRSNDTGAARQITLLGDAFGAAQGTGQVTLDGLTLPVTAWADGAITVSIPADFPIGPHQLLVTAGNGQRLANGLTVHVLSGTGASTGNGAVNATTYNPRILTVNANPVLAGHTNYTSVQAALSTAAADTTARRYLVVVFPGATGLYNPTGIIFENVVMASPVKLQGVGPGGQRADGSSVLGTVLDGTGFTDQNPAADAWRTLVDGTTRVGNQDIAEGEVIYVLAQTTNQYGTAYRAAIDGFTLQGGDQRGFPNNINSIGGGQVGGGPVQGQGFIETQGGAIFVNGYARNLLISNNILKSNGGSYGGAIRLGTPDFGNNENDGLSIVYNRILANGGTNLAGAIGLFAGTDGYEIAYNDLCGNFSAEYGGAISHYGLSPNGRIHHNRIYFNEAYDEGAGIMIAGALPANPNALSAGSGPVDIYNNLIQSNLANDDGGGVRLLMVNSAAINIYNNLIVNNISTHDGAGLALDDAANVRIVNNTIVSNLSTATAATAQILPGGNTPPSPAGIASVRHSTQLQASLPSGAPVFSNPVLFNNILWDNRSGNWDAALGAVTGLGLPGDATPIRLWDAGTSDGSGNLSPFNSILNIGTGTNPDASNRVGAAYDPQVVAPYSTSVAIYPWRTFPTFRDAAIVAVDLPVNLLGNYHLQAASPAVDLGAFSRGTVLAPAADYDGDLRPNGAAVDVGADELSGAAFPANAVLDNFNRANGALGANWRGATGTPGIRLFNNTASLQSSNAATVVWCPACPANVNSSSAGVFGARQEAYLTFNTLRAVNFPQSLVLKATGLNSAGNLVSGSSAIFVGYNHTARTVVVDTQAPVQGAVTRLTIPNVIFAAGDTLGARVLQNGVVGVYRNGQLIGAVNVSAPTGAQPGWPAAQATGGGRIGLQAWGTGAPPSGDIRVDDFGGGNLP